MKYPELYEYYSEILKEKDKNWWDTETIPMSFISKIGYDNIIKDLKWVFNHNNRKEKLEKIKSKM